MQGAGYKDGRLLQNRDMYRSTLRHITVERNADLNQVDKSCCFLYAYALHEKVNITLVKVKVKVKIKVNFTLKQATKAQRGVEVWFHSFFNFGARWSGWSTPHPAALPPGKGSGTHCIGGWVGLRAGLDRCEKSRPHRDLVVGTSNP